MDTSFRPNIPNEGSYYTITVIVPLPDEKILVGGGFKTVDGTRRNAVARLNPDGTLDQSFDAHLNSESSVASILRFPNGDLLLAGSPLITEAGQTGNVARVTANGSLVRITQVPESFSLYSRALAIQADEKIVIGQVRLIRLNGDFSVDSTFNEVSVSNGGIYAIQVQPDGRLLVGGSFRLMGGLEIMNLARLNVDGSMDLDFVPAVYDSVSEILLQPDGKIFSLSRDLVRLHSDGSIDSSFNSSAWFYSFGRRILALQPDGKVLAGTTRFNPDGSVDTSFNIADGLERGGEGIYALALKPGGRILYGGIFRTWHGVPQPNLVQLLSDNDVAPGRIQFAWPRGTPTENLLTMNTTSEGPWAAQMTLVRTDGESGQVSVDWSITGGTATPGADYVPTNGTASFADGERRKMIEIPILDDPFVEPDETIEVSLGNPSGGAALGDNRVAGLIIRQNDYPGTVATDLVTFNFSLVGSSYQMPPEFDWINLKLAVLPDGSTLLGGAFSSLSAMLPVNRIARLRLDGAFDETFTGATGISTGRVYVVTPMADDRILIGGSFVASHQTTAYFGLARLETNGDLDPSFVSSLHTNAAVNSIAELPDRRVLIGGLFGVAASQTISNLARLAPDGSVDISFQPKLEGSLLWYPSSNAVVYAISLQPDGRILAGGNFDRVNGVSRPALARVFPDGSVDPSFGAEISGPVKQIILLPDGKFYIRGLFWYVNGRQRYQIDRLNPDGSSDFSFRPPATFGPLDFTAMAVQPDGELLLGGIGVDMTGSLWPGLFRLNPDGSADATFQNQINGVGALAIQGSSLLVFHAESTGSKARLSRIPLETTSGAPVLQFNSAVVNVEENATNALVTVVRLGDLRPLSVHYATSNGTATAGRDYVPENGTLFFGAGETKKTFDVPILEDILGEDNETINLVLASPTDGAALGKTAQAILKILNDDGGAVDEKFLPRLRGVQALLAQPSGKIIVAGDFVLDDKWRGLARLNPDGSIDESFASEVSLCDYSSDLVAQSDGKILVAGCGPLARIYPDGQLDPAFKTDQSPSAVALQPDGKILLGKWVWRDSDDTGVIRLNADGSRDSTFLVRIDPAPSVSSRVTAIAVLDTGKILIKGDFHMVNGVPVTGFARLNPDGSLDSTNRLGTGGNTFLKKPDGKILVGGGGREYYNDRNPGIAQLLPDGSPDPLFDPGLGIHAYHPRYEPGSGIYAMALQPDGKIVIAGAFDEVDGQPLRCLARLHPDGSLDRTFLPVTSVANDGSVNPMFITPSVVSFRWSEPRSIRAVAVQPDGGIVIAGTGLFARIKGDWSPRPRAMLTTSGGERFFTMSYQRTKLVPNVINVIEVSRDLKTWRAEPAQMEEVGVTDNGDDSETVFVRVTTPIALAPELFIRLTVQERAPGD